MNNKTPTLIIALILALATIMGATALQISGTVSNTAGNPILLVNVSVANASGVQGYVVTSSNGAYTLDAPLQNGTYWLNFTQSGYDNASQLIDLIEGQNEVVNRVLGPPQVTYIKGTITESGTTNTLGGVTITATGSSGGIFTTTTDGAGNYVLPVISTQSPYDVDATLISYFSNTTTGVTVTDLLNGTASMTLTPVPATSNVYGVVEDINGNPLNGVTIKVLLNNGLIRTATTGVAGDYSITDTFGATYDMQASLISYFLSEKNGIQIANGDSVEVNFILYQSACVQTAQSCSSWSTCSSNQQSRTCTVTNYNNVCMSTSTVTEPRSCSTGGGGGSSSGGGGGSGSSRPIRLVLVLTEDDPEDTLRIRHLTTVAYEPINAAGKYEFRHVGVYNNRMYLDIVNTETGEVVGYNLKPRTTDRYDLDGDGDDDIVMSAGTVLFGYFDMKYSLIADQPEEPEEDNDAPVVEDDDEPSIVDDISNGILSFVEELDERKSTPVWVGIIVMLAIIALGLGAYFIWLRD